MLAVSGGNGNKVQLFLSANIRMNHVDVEIFGPELLFVPAVPKVGTSVRFSWSMSRGV